MGQPQSKSTRPGTKFRVIGAGMSRTGTKTFNEALQIILDGPCHDSGIHSTGGTSKQVNEWLEVMELVPKPGKTYAEKKRIEWLLADLLDGYVATMDAPAAAMTEELMATFPDALVIVTTRDAKSWWKSMEHVHQLTGNLYMPFLLLFVPRVRKYLHWLRRFSQLAQWRYGTDIFQPDGITIHEAYLRKVVPPEKLFFYDVKSGWGPLCKILDVPIPDIPFPHNNSKLEAQKTHDTLVKVGIFYWLLVIGVSTLTIWGGLRARAWVSKQHIVW